MTTQLDHFETILLSELREHVADRAPLAQATTPAKRRAPRLLLAGFATAGVAVAAVVLVPGLGANPAYSVQEGNRGEIEVQVNRFEDAAGLERALATYGVEADITYVPDGGQCAPQRYRPVARDGGGIAVSTGSELFRITLEPGTIRDGETLVIDASLLELPDSVDPDTGLLGTGGIRVYVDAEVAPGPVPACSPVPAPSAQEID